MARPPQEAIDTFISITGADEALAVRKLEEHGGDLNQAINSHFNEGDSTLNRINQNTTPPSHDDMMDVDGPLDNTFQRSFPQTFRDPFALIDPNFQQQFFDRIGSTDTSSHGSLVSQPREAREVPIEVRDSEPQTGPSDQAPVIEDVTGHESSQDRGVRETIIIDDEDEGLSSAASARHADIPNNMSPPNPTVPSAPPLVHVNDYDDDIEEEMIRAAIEASKKDGEGLTNTVEQDRDQNPEGVNMGAYSEETDMGIADGTVGRQGRASGKAGTSRQPIDEESLQEEAEDVEEEPLVRRRSRRFPSENTDLAQPVHPDASPVPNFPPPSNLNDRQNNGDEFPSEWGGISAEEHDEAVMLEAAMFGGVPEGPTYPFPMPSHRSSTHYPPIVHSPPPELTEQRLLREQQDDEYLASLQADQEKAELRRQEEAAARKAAIEKEKQEEEERSKKKLEEEELESNLASKQASLPLEPPPDIEGAVTLVVRMPDGSRQGRRFLKSDKLQFLFDFLDVGRTCKPGTYRLVRSYPRRTFTSSEGDTSFSDLGLTSKQEALFLEQITE
ncbi:hypothetical protein EJB05_42275 [Eragrostis curvula]|uniref:UBX domain-containing protein n=1 Tax=Eragrostis curvula TaxID=38414 RepID=A0A5J9TC18_9POAL|nr:hypothetical protein EJB05_42275 [Eragrostis curvula]